MGNSISARWKYFTALCREGIFGKLLGSAWLILGIWVVFRDEFWMPTNENEWRIINMIPHISLSWWLVGALSIVIVWIFEASFRLTRRLEGSLPLKPRFHAARFYQKTDGDRCFWYVDIQNVGPALAKGFRFQLDGIEDGPNDPSWKGLYPYDVRPEKIKHLPAWSAVQLAIDRDETMPFELFETRLSSDEKFRVVGLDARKPDRLNDAAVVLNPGEKWLLTYKIGANDADLLTLHVRIDFKDGKPVAEKVD
jgi:hypothetical protein